jgi:asparagine synthase (glutamine-hydrolysing)
MHRRGRPVDEAQIRRMSETLVHRGPDGSGVHIATHIGLGHRRLSIIDLETGKQPMSDPDGTVQVVFNGEIYNFLELKKVLEGKGHVFRTRSDTESIIHAYLEWGEDFVRRLRGMFAIGLWDARRNMLILVRDRIGEKPLYYLLDDNRLAFASELKALLTLPDLERRIDPQALDAYLSFGYVPSPLSILQGVRKLPPATMAVCTPDRFSTKTYWQLRMIPDSPPIKESQAVLELAAIFDEAVRLRLVSDVPLGAFLSGGVDSSAVVASMARLLGQAPVKTTSIGFQEKKINELEFAKIVARKYQTEHSEFVVQPEALAILDKVVWHLDEPFADSSAIPTWYVSEMARRKVTVALSGDGGDEIFAGYVQRYRMNQIEDRLRRLLPSFIRSNLLKPLSNIYPRAANLPRPLRLKQFLTNLSRPLEEAYFRDMSFYFKPEMKTRLYAPDLAAGIPAEGVQHFLGHHFQSVPGQDALTKVQYVDMMTYLPNDILVKVDRMSMAHALEVRTPLLDHLVLEFAARLPSRLKLHKGESKFIFKKMNEPRLPSDILYRKKHGFIVPLANWTRGPLQELARDCLFSPTSAVRDMTRPDYIRELWTQHQDQREDNASQIWCLMMLELWQRRFLRKDSGSATGDGAWPEK